MKDFPKTGLTWEEADAAALDRQEWHWSVDNASNGMWAKSSYEENICLVTMIHAINKVNKTGDLELPEM